jgi:hypothetical protein
MLADTHWLTVAEEVHVGVIVTEGVNVPLAVKEGVLVPVEVIDAEPD